MIHQMLAPDGKYVCLSITVYDKDHYAELSYQQDVLSHIQIT